MMMGELIKEEVANLQLSTKSWKVKGWMKSADYPYFINCPQKGGALKRKKLDDLHKLLF